jgi:uncharacterized protein (UPF0303 family)
MDSYLELLEELKNEEETIQFSEFNSLIALKLGLKLVDAAMRDRKNVTVDICLNGQQLFHHAMAGTTRDNDEWIKRKNRVVNRFGHSSYYMGIYYKSKGTTIQEKSFLNPARYAPHGGAFPLIIRNVGVVGTVTVSGLPQEEDHKLVVSTLKEFLQS